MSSNDFDGPRYGSAGGREADEQGAGAPDARQQGAGRHSASGQSTPDNGREADGAQYPAPEGWGNDGFWRDSSVDADYETGRLTPVRPESGPRENPGYSYWADGRGWESSPTANQQPGPEPGAPSFDPSPGFSPARSAYGTGAFGVGAAGTGAGTGSQPTGSYGAAGNPGGYGTPGGPVGPGNPGPGGTAGYGLAVPGGPGSFGGPGGPGRPGGPSGPGGPTGPGGPGGPGGPRRPQGRNGKRKGSWWRHWSWKKALAVAGSFVVIVVLALFGVYQYLSSSATIPTALASATYQNTTVYYSDGKTPIGTIGLVNRQDLTFGQIPKKMQDAVLAAEDRSFWTEGGISPTGILRAAYDDVSSSGGGSLSGGSTITQEFVRGYYDGIGAQQTVSRKVKEVFIAQKLSKTKSKSWILTNYLNLIYLGKNSYGVAAAAQTYFGVPVGQLTIAQEAVIAAIIQQPSNYPLPAYRSSLTARWHYVLNGMVKMGDLTQAQADTAKFPKLLTDSSSGSAGQGASLTSDSKDPWVPYIMDVVEHELTATGAGADNVSSQLLETGGLKIVTTISLSKEKAMYAAVNQEFANIKSQGYKIPAYVLTGAELQNPANGQILAMYPGPGQDMSTAKCAKLDCDLNTAVYTREQVGSSFKPYVLSAAVLAGMNVKTSTLNANQYLCVPGDGTVASQLMLSKPMSYYPPGLICPGLPGYFPVENDGGEVIGSAKQGGGTTVQNALAQSSNTAFTDLTHRVSTASVIEMANNFGVDIHQSGLTTELHGVGLALGISSLTVNEQTTMLATIDDNGVYHKPHIVGYWQQPAGPEQTPALNVHNIFNSNPTINAAMDSQVQYAMEMTTVDGTGTAAAYGLGDRQIIAKTGTTTSSHAGFFIGAIPQYALVVGMFTASQDDKSMQSITPLGGGGFGGARPAEVWNIFARAEFAGLPSETFQNPVFTGAKWNQIGKLPKPKPTVNCVINGKKVKVKGKTCPTPTPTPTPTPSCSYDQNGNYNCTGTGTAAPSPGCSYDQNGQYQCSTTNPTATPSPNCSYDQNGQYQCSTTNPTATPSPTCTFDQNGQSNCGTQTGQGSQAAPGTQATPGARASLAFGGGLTVLPGSLLWTTVRRRRRNRRGGSAAQ